MLCPRQLYNSVEGSPPLPSPRVVILIPVSRPTLAIKMKPEVVDIDRLPETARTIYHDAFLFLSTRW